MFLVLSGTHPGEELLVHMVTPCLTCCGTTELFSKGLAPFYIPSASFPPLVSDYHFSHSLLRGCESEFTFALPLRKKLGGAWVA